MVGPADPIAEFEHRFGKRIRIMLATLVVGGLFPVGFLSYLFVSGPGNFPAWILIVIYVPAELILTAVLIRWFRRRLEPVRSLPRAVRHRLAASGVGRSANVVFDNGLVCTSMIQYRLFGSPTGGRLIPTSEQVAELTRGMVRMRAVLRVGRRQGPESLQVRLDSIRDAMNARFSNLFVHLPRQASPPDPRRPSWVSTASFDVSPAHLDPHCILDQIDPLARLLEDAAAMAREVGARTPAVPRPRLG